MQYRLEIPMEPRGKQRPRMARSGSVYTPKETRIAEGIIAHALAMDGAQAYKGPIEVCIYAYFTRPKSNRNAQHIVKPDIDNVAKLVLDGCKRHFDDKLVTRLVCEKHYAKDKPCIIIEITPVAG